MKTSRRCRPPEVVKRARAAIAAGDKAACWLWHRYLGQRLAPTGPDGMPQIRSNGSPTHLELVTVVRELGAPFGEDERAQKRREIEAKVRAAQALPLAVTTVRNDASGETGRSLEAYRRHLAAHMTFPGGRPTIGTCERRGPLPAAPAYSVIQNRP